MRNKILLIAAALVLGLAAALLFWQRPLTLIVDGQAQTLRTRAWTVAGALNEVGLAVSKEDSLSPAPGTLLLGAQEIRVERARTITLVDEATGENHTIASTADTPAEWLEEAGIERQETDQLYVNSQPVELDQPLPIPASLTVQIRQSVPLTVEMDGETQTLETTADTLGEALWEAGISISAADSLSLPAETPLDGPIEVKIEPARPVSIRLQEGQVEILTSAEIVGEALAEAGIALQGLDYSQPEETASIPENGSIRVVRVREETILEQTSIPYSKEYTQDPNVELDTTAVTQAGEFGIEVSRIRVRFEDGQETARQEEAKWVAKEPKNEIVGYGTKVVVKTLDTPDGPIEYYRAVTVYATSYSPCRSAADRCYPGTSLGLPVTRGVIGVTRAWYNQFAGQKLYVPGYGTGVIADTGGGVPGEYWIDLGFSDADFQPWHQYVTVYFLTPIPPNVPWILP